MSFVEEFEITIPSDTVAGKAVQERIVKILEEANYSTREVFGVRLALEEALVNAIKHGNRSDLKKSVRIYCHIRTDRIRVEIEDQGKGFCVDDVPDPTAEENLEKPCGRGIMLMRAFMTTIEYNEAGNRILLEKYREVTSAAGEPETGE